MPTVWFSLKKSLHCRSEASDVHSPKTRKQLSTILTRKSARSGCSRSIANLKDVIHGSKRHLEIPQSSCSPRSIGSSEFLNPITHEVMLSDSRTELKIAGVQSTVCYFNPAFRTSTTLPKNSPLQQHSLDRNCSSVGGSTTFSGGDSVSGRSSNRMLFGPDGSVSSAITCHKCEERFGKWEAAEAHHLSKHAVTELVEGDSSRKVVEIICKTGWSKSEPHSKSNRIERILKVHNTQRTLTRFEEHRESVKTRASKLPKKHPRCLADGNELLRFYGTTVTCSLGLNGSSSLCSSERCCVCQIIRNGFSMKKDSEGGIGVFTSSTSGRAFELIEKVEEEVSSSVRKALIVCRVIAGRVHRPVENIEEMAGQTGFDSLAGKVGVYSNIEELYLLSPRALLPCFVVICKN